MPRSPGQTSLGRAWPTSSSCVSVAALDNLHRLAEEGGGPFDFVFVDADKPNNPEYLAWALRLTRSGSVLVFDNVVRGGAVVADGRGGPTVQGTRRLVELLAAEPRVSATAIQTVGEKGHDGFALALVLAGASDGER